MLKFSNLLLFMLVFNSQFLFANDGYEPSKLAAKNAELKCQSIASISLDRRAVLSITAHVKPKIISGLHEGKGIIAISYPYRHDGVEFACVFYDYMDGQLQLIEFGEVGGEVEKVTKVNLLY